ncbi:hypothetical protein TSUD_21990 [Trifolium subterraneum]|uniref:Reverse transcriptase domain-containing protein n=1 Tax=Trifolium subterraneum TaxID=3900 RepID=A0A2Z6MAK2_TRISU|nr:hypothetical protein TSUD_21990 [Trifolium subterraneum]
MNGDGAPGPDGFSGHFFQQYWDIVASDVVYSVQSFFLTGKLSQVAAKIISPQQRGFIPERHIADCVIIASEAINVLSNKTFAGNIALKIDIRKAFDTLDWNFLLAVLKQFGFMSIFSSWISEILLSAKLSVLVKGKSVGFFSCTRGVRQGDPLSPLLFCIAEDVLSRSISKALLDGKLSPMSLCRNVVIPTHVLYVDDIMVINKQKSKFYPGSISNSRLTMITNLLGFTVGSTPFNYLGCPIFVGTPKVIHFKAIADKIKVKLASWKGSLLSIIGRVQLVKSIIHGMLVYSFHIYAWPKSLLKKLDSWIRNFIWSGDVNTKKICTVAWRKICRSLDEGGLDIHSLYSINNSLMLHLCWKFFSSNDQWVVMCRSRYLKFGLPKNSFLKSSIWHGIKPHVNTVKTHTRWLLGSGNSVAFWLDKWLQEPLVDLFHLPTSSYSLLTARVSEYIENGVWNIPASIVQHDASIQASIDQIILPKQPLEDRLIWCSSKDGILSAKQAYMHLYPRQNQIDWTTWIWHVFVPPSTSFIAWRCFHDRMPTDENLMKRGCISVSACDLCLAHSRRLRTCSLLVASRNNSGSDVLHVIHSIWLARNGVRFNNAKITAHAAKMKILTSIKHSAQLAAGVSTAAEKQANTDGSVTVGSAASGGLFRDYMANFRGAFVQKISGHYVLHSELTTLILAMEIAHMPWDLRNRWSNCFMLGLTLKWSHICREGNACADKLANIGHLHTRTRWWESLPSMLQDDFLSDRLGIPQYRTT